MKFTPQIRHEQIILTKFDEGEGVLIDVRTKRYYRLNETALIIWQGLQQQQPLPQIIRHLTEVYDVNERQATSDVTDVLNDFQTRQLITL